MTNKECLKRGILNFQYFRSLGNFGAIGRWQSSEQCKVAENFVGLKVPDGHLLFRLNQADTSRQNDKHRRCRVQRVVFDDSVADG